MVIDLPATPRTPRHLSAWLRRWLAPAPLTSGPAGATRKRPDTWVRHRTIVRSSPGTSCSP